MESHSTDLATHKLALRFFDLATYIQADSGSFINLFARMYRRFQVDAFSSPAQPPVEFAVLTDSDNPWGQPVLIINREVRPLNNPRLLEGYIYDGILNAIVAGVRSHFLIHAGVVSYGSQGIILVADSGHGKTTLVLELIRRGFKFLSDEMAALGRADRRVHPFPRSLRIRPGTLEMVGFPKAAHGAPEWLGKLLLDVEEIQPGAMGQATPISHIVILQDPIETEPEQADGSERELGILVDRLDKALLAAVRQIEGVSQVWRTVERGHPTIRLRAAHRMSVISRIEALCQEQGILLLDISKKAESKPTFELPARLESVSSSEAVMELLRRFQGGHKSALLQEEFEGSAVRLFMELAALVDQAKCYRLYIGRLSEMADLVSGLVTHPTL